MTHKHTNVTHTIIVKRINISNGSQRVVQEGGLREYVLSVHGGLGAVEVQAEEVISPVVVHVRRQRPHLQSATSAEH